jgi:ribonuclease HII
MMKIVNDIDFAGRGGSKLKKVFKEELLIIEKKLAFEGYTLIAGVDEAGRGPLAGPVIAAACILPERFDLPYLDDSKKLTAKRRDDLFDRIREQAVAYAIAGVEAVEIDNVNILNASKMAMKKAVEALTDIPDYVLVDGRDELDIRIRQKAVIDGDAKCASIAAGSILAKVTRDRIMEDLHMLYPQYAFDRHKGYGTKLHMEMLEKYGPCPIHRYSYAPVRDVAAKFSQGLA